MFLHTIYERIQMNRIVNLKEIGQSAMRAQVATFAGCPIPSQFGSRQAPKKREIQTSNALLCKQGLTNLHVYRQVYLIPLRYSIKPDI
jgi:hypothetical protein